LLESHAETNRLNQFEKNI